MKKILCLVVFMFVCTLLLCNKSSEFNNYNNTPYMQTPYEFNNYDPVIQIPQVPDVDEDQYKQIPKEFISLYEHVEKISSFDSEYSVGYRNKNGTYTQYIFPYPIKYENEKLLWEDIDNSLIEADGEYKTNGYAYQNKNSNIKTYYPQKLNDENCFLIEGYANDIKFGLEGQNLDLSSKENLDSIFGITNDTVLYQNENLSVKSYSVYSGIKTEIEVLPSFEQNSLTFYLQSTRLKAKLDVSGHIILYDINDPQKTVGIIRMPIIEDSSGKIFIDNKLELTGKDELGYYITFLLPKCEETQYPLTVDMSEEFYKEKQNDAAIYSKQPDANRILDDYIYLGDSDIYGTGISFNLLNIKEYVGNNAENIKNVSYAVYSIANPEDEIDIDLNRITEYWNSATLTWDNRVNYNMNIDKKTVKGSQYTFFNITDLVKDMIINNDGDIQENGIALKTENRGKYCLMASANNLAVPPLQIITYDNLPT
jgi:hypothetical protein